MTAEPSSQRDWLRLARTKNVGPVTFQQLLKRFGTAAAALDALPALARQGGRLASLVIPTIGEIEAELAAGAALGGRLLTGAEAAFPSQLAALDPPPPVIWALATPPC